MLGGDGYLGWPTALNLSSVGHDVAVVDNFVRRRWDEELGVDSLVPILSLEERLRAWHRLSGIRVTSYVGDLCDGDFVASTVSDFDPDTIVHYAEQSSAPYSMLDRDHAVSTQVNNVVGTLNVLYAIAEHNRDIHLVKLGTMGEYGTPNIDIEEGWLDVSHNGRRHKFLYPRQAGSLYHTTKVLDTDLLWFYVRTYGLRVTDLMQGPVYGLDTNESAADKRLAPSFHYDDIFGTVVNRFLVQAVAGIPLTVYGRGGQTRGYLNLLDTLQCVELAMKSPVERGELRILNQFTEQFTVNELAQRVRDAGKRLGIEVRIESIENPRKELEEHYYNARHSGLLELRLKPHFMTEEVLEKMLSRIMECRDAIDPKKVMPRVSWRS